MRVVEKPYLYRKREAPAILSGRRLFPQGDPCLQGVAAEEFLRPRRKLVFFQEPYFYGKRGVPTRLSGCRLRSPGRPLLTMMGCRLRPPVADWCRLVPKAQLLHTRDGADRPTPFRSYIILYVNGDGGDRVRTPHCTGAPAPNGRRAKVMRHPISDMVSTRSPSHLTGAQHIPAGRVRGEWQVSLVRLYFAPVCRGAEGA